MAPLIDPPALNNLAAIVQDVLQYAVWAIIIGYIYYFWILIFGPGSAQEHGSKLGEFVKDKGSDIAGWNSKRKKAAKDFTKAQKLSLLEYDDLGKLYKKVENITTVKQLEKIQKAKKAAKRHEAKATARFKSLVYDLMGDSFKELFKKEPALKGNIKNTLQKIKAANGTVILKINDFEQALKNPLPSIDVSHHVSSQLLPPLKEAIVAERDVQAGFEAIKDILTKRLGKIPRFSLW